MDRSQARVVVHFSTDDPSRHFKDLNEAIDFLAGSDWRCLSGRAWIEAPAVAPPSLAGSPSGESILWPPFSSEHSTLVH